MAIDFLTQLLSRACYNNPAHQPKVGCWVAFLPEPEIFQGFAILSDKELKCRQLEQPLGCSRLK